MAQRPGVGKPYQPGTYTYPPQGTPQYSVTLQLGGEITVRPGDWISKYAACLYGDAQVGWNDFGWRNPETRRVEPLPDPNQITVGQAVFHLPTFRRPPAIVITVPAPYALDTVEGRLQEVLRRALPKLAPEVREQLEALITPAAVAIMAATLVAWVAGHFFGVGEAIDVVLLVLGVAAIGLAVFAGLEHFYGFAHGVVYGKTDEEFEAAAEHFAEAVAVLGIQAVLGLLFKGAPKSFKGNPIKLGTPPPIRKGWWYRPKVRRSGSMKPGEGSTTVWGDIVVSVKGTVNDRRLALLHEQVHSFLTPRFRVLREFRVQNRAASYERSALSRYVEEALAETVAQVGVNGFRGAFTGLYFPVKNGYVTVLVRANGKAPFLPELVGLLTEGFLFHGLMLEVWHSAEPPPVREEP